MRLFRTPFVYKLKNIPKDVLTFYLERIFYWKNSKNKSYETNSKPLITAWWSECGQKIKR
ncbi:hypothetical protein ABE26_09235 [Cytobacillus firmus]|nr:hypothetical protein [Cytobacillus firmus]